MTLKPEDRDLPAKKRRFEKALETLVGRLQQDRYVLAAVLVGSLSDEVIWKRESISLWIIETDGVTRRRPSDGKDERIFRTLVEDDVNIHAEIIPRSRFKQMIEGTSRTAFTYSFFAHRRLLYSVDPSIAGWFEEASRLGVRDQQRELLVVASWTVHPLRHAEKLLELQGDLELTYQVILHAVWALAGVAIVRHGEVCEDKLLYRAMELEPELFDVVYTGLLESSKSLPDLRRVLDAIDGELEKNAASLFGPVLTYLKQADRMVPLSEIADDFAYSQIYPWHIESCCEWLAEKGWLEKVSMPLRLTTKSRVELEEPAYFYHD